MTTVYFLSGLGSDKRIFKNLKLHDCNIKYLKWLEPEQSDSITDYALKLSKQIDSEADIILAGLSFGGIMVQELAKIVTVKKIILISSVQSSTQFPFYLKLLRATHIHRILPFSSAKFITPLFYRSMGAVTSVEKTLVKDFLRTMSHNLLKWSVKQIVEWESSVKLNNLIHIHGSDDKVFPLKSLNPDYIIKNGTHFMCYNKADEISEIIQTEIDKV